MSASSNETPRLGRATAGRGPFVPLLLLTLGFLAWMTLQTTQLMLERQGLKSAMAQQAEPLAASQKLRAACDSLASKMQILANRGDANAQSVVEDLKKHGITINAHAHADSPP